MAGYAWWQRSTSRAAMLLELVFAPLKRLPPGSRNGVAEAGEGGKGSETGR